MEDVNSVPKVGLIGENIENKMYDISLLQNTEIQKIYLVKRITLRARLCSILFASAITVKYEQFYTIQNFKKIFNFDDLLTPSNT